jgi:hypothetical protein
MTGGRLVDLMPSPCTNGAAPAGVLGGLEEALGALKEAVFFATTEGPGMGTSLAVRAPQ